MCGGFALIIKYCFKSKCENVQICGGLIKIKRRVDLEINDDDSPTEEPENRPEELTQFGSKDKVSSHRRRQSLTLNRLKKNLTHQ